MLIQLLPGTLLAPVDPYSAYVAALYHFDEPVGNLVFGDSSGRGHGLIRTGDPSYSAEQAKFGSTSLYVNQANALSNAHYVQSIAHPDFVLGGDFTIEAWGRFKGQTRAFMGLASSAGTDSGTAHWKISRRTSDGKAYAGLNAGSVISLAAVNADTWYHYALERVGSTVTFFIDGAVQGTVTDTNTTLNQFEVGRGSTATDNQSWYGFIQDFRITNGVARYGGATFTPPIALHPDSMTFLGSSDNSGQPAGTTTSNTQHANVLAAHQSGELLYLYIRGGTSNFNGAYRLTIYEATSTGVITTKLGETAIQTGLAAGQVKRVQLVAPVTVTKGNYYAVCVHPNSNMTVGRSVSGDVYYFADIYSDGSVAVNSNASTLYSGGGALWARGAPDFNVDPITTTEYTHYRIDIDSVNGGTNVSCAELELYDADGNNFINKSASDGGTFTASSTSAGTGISATNAFSGHMNAPYGWVSNSTSVGWLRVQCPFAQEFVGVAITNRPDEANRSPSAFTIEYSNDGISWAVAHSEGSETGWQSAETKRFAWASVGAKLYWRINVTAVDGGSMIGIASLLFIRADGSVYSNTPAAAAVITTDFFSTAYFPIFMLNGVGTTGWVSLAGTAKEIIVHLPVAKALAALAWTAMPAEGNRSPRTWQIYGSNSPFNDGWTELKSFVDHPLWGSNERRLFDGSS